MNFENTTPESVNISSAKVLKYIKRLEALNFPIHSLIMARGNKIFAEYYWKPFNKDYCHRMYSQTKSFVGITVGELAKEGKLSLDDKIIDYFPDKLPEKISPNLAAQTIRHMLTMHTSIMANSWFTPECTDRVKFYFSQKAERYPGTTFFYDSTGSFILGALIERVTGKTFLEYLREKCLDEIGFSKEAHHLYCPGGNAWADSSLLCTSRDMLSFARLLLNGGKYNGKQLLNEDNVKEATSNLVSTNDFGINTYNTLGYGHQIWASDDGAFAFHGMHGQHTICHPKTDIILTITASYPEKYSQTTCEAIFRGFFEDIVYTADKNELSWEDYKELSEYTKDLKLYALKGKENYGIANSINGKKYIAEENPMGIKEFFFEIQNEGLCKFNYINAQGEKTLYFRMNENEISYFPEEGYSDTVGNTFCEGHKYRCAASGTWRNKNKLGIFVQIIDEYFGSLDIEIAFNKNYAVLKMEKYAEAFLNEYSGCVTARADE